MFGRRNQKGRKMYFNRKVTNKFLIIETLMISNILKNLGLNSEIIYDLNNTNYKISVNFYFDSLK